MDDIEPSDIDTERDLALAGSAVDAFAPVGILGMIVGGVFGACILIIGYLRRTWSRMRPT